MRDALVGILALLASCGLPPANAKSAEIVNSFIELCPLSPDMASLRNAQARVQQSDAATSNERTLGAGISTYEVQRRNTHFFVTTIDNESLLLCGVRFAAAPDLTAMISSALRSPAQGASERGAGWLTVKNGHHYMVSYNRRSGDGGLTDTIIVILSKSD